MRATRVRPPSHSRTSLPSPPIGGDAATGVWRSWRSRSSFDRQIPTPHVMKLTPLGDQAVLAYLPDEAAAVRFAAAVRAAGPPWLHVVVPAYASVGVFFDADRIGLPEVTDWL